MSNIIDFLDSKETFKKVISTLRKYDTQDQVPKILLDGRKGSKKPFISGGSVANILISMIHGGEPIINDIDIYNEVKESAHKTGKDWYPDTSISGDGLEIVDDSYGRIYVNDAGAMMRVTGHRRLGIINIVDFIYEQTPVMGDKIVKSRNQVVLEGFDINCCKAGVDMDEEKIIYTPEFVEYLETKQLKVTNPCAPIQTAIRLLKKIDSLDCFCNIEHEMRFLTVASKHLSTRYISNYIGPETEAKYQIYKDRLKKYFTLREPKDSTEIPHNMRDKFYVGNKRNPDVKIWVFDSVMNFDVIENPGDTINTLKRVWYLLYTTKKKGEQDRINKIIYKNIFLGKINEDIWHKRNHKEEKDEPYFSTNRFTYSMLLVKPDYHKCDFDLKHVDFIDTFGREHTNIRFISSKSKNLMEHYRILKFIKSVAKKEGDWVIGILENLSHSKYGEKIKSGITKELILNIVEEEKKANSAELIESVDLSGFKFRSSVQELNTTLMLMSEGNKMGHCVGGYSGSVKDGRSRIFHIEYNGIGSTVEISVPSNKRNKRVEETNGQWGWGSYKEFTIVDVYRSSTDVKNECIVFYDDGTSENIRISELLYKSRQHYGRYPEKGNLTPTEENKKIVEKLVEYLNENSLPGVFKNKNLFLADNKENVIFV